MHELDKASGNGIKPLLIVDGSGLDRVAAETAWLRKQPNLGFSNVLLGREWIIESDNLIITPGGNPIA